MIDYYACNFSLCYHCTLIAACFKLFLVRHIKDLLYGVEFCIEDVSIGEVTIERATKNYYLALTEGCNKGIRSCLQHARYDCYCDPNNISTSVHIVVCIEPFNAIQPLSLFVVSAKGVD